MTMRGVLTARSFAWRGVCAGRLCGTLRCQTASRLQAAVVLASHGCGGARYVSRPLRQSRRGGGRHHRHALAPNAPTPNAWAPNARAPNKQAVRGTHCDLGKSLTGPTAGWPTERIRSWLSGVGHPVGGPARHVAALDQPLGVHGRTTAASRNPNAKDRASLDLFVTSKDVGGDSSHASFATSASVASG